MLRQVERDEILGPWSGPPHDPDLARDELLHQLFEAQADSCPGQTAIECDPDHLTYAEVDRRANQLAHWLRARGIGPGKYVAIWLPRSADVYVTMLAVLKAGAAYVPLDPGYPGERVGYILSDSRAHTLVTTTTLAAKHQPSDVHVLLLDQQQNELTRQPADRIPPEQTGATPDDVCYVIYTSGSTGRPKGVMIPHRSACNLVRAEGRIFHVGGDDRVYQGFSVAFDASVEEIWLALFAGATLVVGTEEMIQAGPALTRLLTAARVSVFSTVPTLLAMLEGDLPTVRLLVTGGEACPQHLVRRWWQPGRRMVNTYGPTEATVIATFGDCHPDQPVTIGRAVPNYRTYILDGDMQPLPAGVAGELHIGGASLAKGYLGQPELTVQRFVPDPFSEDPSARLYKTGDLVRYTSDGRIDFLGRIDSQVKIRGFRVELSEIEAVMMECAGVRSAAVTVHRDDAGIDHLVGYVVRSGETPIEADTIKSFLRQRLPGYMVPSLVQWATELPTLSSGKVDRKRLPPPDWRQSRPENRGPAPETPRQKKIAAAWERLFKAGAVTLNEDFFLDLGGHSLLAATVVSQLRAEADFRDLSVLDMYHFPTVRLLAAEFDTRRGQDREDSPAAAGRIVRTSSRAHFFCGLAQALSLYFVAGFFALQWLTPYLAYCWMAEHDYGTLVCITTSLSALLGLYPVMLLVAVAAKWIILGRVRAGQHPLWGVYYFRWWLAHQFLGAVPIDYLAGTPLLSWYYRLLGAKIGRNVYFGTDAVGVFDLLAVGDDTSIGFDASLSGYTVEDGLLKIAPITIGKRCFVGASAIVGMNARIEDNGCLGVLSLLPGGSRIPRGQTWVGSPAQPVSDPATAGLDRPAAQPSPGLPRRLLMLLGHAIGVFVIPAAYLAAIFPGMMLLHYLGTLWEGYWFVAGAPLAAMSFVGLLAFEIVAVKWLLLGRVKPGRYWRHGGFYLRKWFVDQLMDLSLDLLGSIYATVYLAPWYRLLGAKLGRNAEISTACAASPDLVQLDDETFIADCVSLGVPSVDRDTLTLAPTRIGRRAFVGNSGLVPAGTVIGENTLLGVLSAPPLVAPGLEQPDTTWLGSPAIFLPQRQSSAPFAEQSTFRPTRKLFLLRAAIEFCRINLPPTLFVVLTSVLISLVIFVRDTFSLPVAIALFPLLYLGGGLTATAIAIAAKWILMGRLKPAEKPLWSHFVWRAELLIAVHENLANPFLLDMLQGTPFVSWFLRLLGAKIGRRVYLETAEFTEFDLVRVGDDSALNLNATIQTHLFEDRVMKMSTIDIGAGCTVGAGSVVLYDTSMQDGAALGDLSLLMKGETLPALTHWEGTPARPKVGPPAVADSGTAPNFGPTKMGLSPSAGTDSPCCQHDGQFEILSDLASTATGEMGVWVVDLDQLDLEPLAQSGPSTGTCVCRPQPTSSTASQAVLRQILGRRLGVDPESLVLETTPLGKPTVRCDHRHLACEGDLDFSLSHSKNLLAIAVSDGRPIGVDLELVQDDRDVLAAAQHFSAAEQARLAALPPDRQVEAFYRCWTAKEAVMKALGQGLRLGLDHVETQIATDSSIRVVALGDSGHSAHGWRVTHRLLHFGPCKAVLAVATAPADRQS